MILPWSGIGGVQSPCRSALSTRRRSKCWPFSVRASTEARTEKGQHLLRLRVDSAERQGDWTPPIPDHGKIMHLFLVGEGPRAFAHLHPTRRSDTEFETALPPLPAGAYHVYADVTHENGFSETLTNRVQIPPPSSEMKRLWLGNSA